MTDVSEPHVWQVEADVRPLPDKVLVCDMEHGDKMTRGGLIIPDDSTVERGIRPRWGTVYKVGADVSFVKPGDRILVAHGRWTRGVKIRTPEGEHLVIRMVESDSILGVDATS
jgi:co-chaperonin GroES (HSP10)